MTDTQKLKRLDYLSSLPYLDHTPEDWDEMYHYIGQYSGSEKTVAAVVAGMVNNLSHKLVEDLIAGEHLRYKECRHDVLRRLTKHIK